MPIASWKKGRTPLAGIVSFHNEYEAATTFTPEDVRDLIKKAGFVAVDKFDPDAVARKLAEALSVFIATSPTGSTAIEKLKWVRQVRDRALGLMKILNIDPKTGRFLQDDPPFILALNNLDDSNTFLMRQGIGNLLWTLTHAEKLPVLGQQPVFEEDDEHWEEPEVRVPSAGMTTLLAGHAIACVARMAEAAIDDLVLAAPGKRRTATVEVRLVKDLCQIYHIVSGHEETLTLEGPAIQFCKEVAKKTVERLREPLPPNNMNFEYIKSALTRIQNNSGHIRDRIRDFRKEGHRAR